jgi:tetratricopeptide (TPR) repeat protein
MNSFSAVFALFLTLASACAFAQEAAAPAAVAKAEEQLPKQELTGQILYHFLLGEIAAQRGELSLSASTYLELAKTTRDPRIVRRAAEIAFHARQFDSALEAGRLWQSLEPESPQARQMVSTLLLASGRIDELAGSLAKNLAAEAPREGDALIRLGRAFARYPDKVAVKRLVDQLTLPYLGLPEAHLVLAQAAIGLADLAGANSEIDRALALRPGWELAALFKAEILPKGQERLDFLKTWLAANPDANDVRLGYARALVGEKDYEASRVEFRRLLSANPDNPDILYAVGILSLQVNDAADAERQLKRFVEIGRGDLDPARFYLGQIADQAGRAEDALHWYDQVAAGEHLLPAQVRAAQVLVRQNKLDEAREHLAAARTTMPGDVRLLVAEAQLLRDVGRHEEAFAFLANALELQPEDPDLLYETALAAEKLGYVDLMERHLRRLMVVKPDSPQAYNALGYSLADRNLRLDEAAQLLDKALELSPDDSFILDSKGWLLFRQGDHAAALELLKKAYADKRDPEIAGHMGEVLWALGRPTEAVAVWREARKEHPTNEALAATIKRFAP